MSEYTFKFYKDENYITMKTFDKQNVEDAYLEADKFLIANKKLVNDWDYVNPKNRIGTQKSPFGIGS
tara:strand:+ start:250 stop:450 length:201 start_codon:yes stop_codon:yes gene_type:complete